MGDALGNGGWNGLAFGDHDSFYLARKAAGAGQKGKNELLS